MSTTATSHSGLPHTVTALAMDVPGLVVLGTLIAEPMTRTFALINLAAQAALFVLVACLPAARTGVMAFVDLAWPTGVGALGIEVLLQAPELNGAVITVAGIYVVLGGRMAVWALTLLRTNFPHEDLPRYRFQRLRWEKAGYRGELVPMLHEILQQGLANASVLALPAALAVADSGRTFDPGVALGLAVWAGAWALESVADLQKRSFILGSAESGESRTCDVGLWAYSRHPNYFFQWVQWHGLIIIGASSLVTLAGGFGPAATVLTALGLLGISAAMAFTLIYYTGAIPAEHFSVLHRPSYRDYQDRVPMFLPRRPARR